eukprot:9700391-Ditylum_brightwellii.AAC.1
MQGTMIKTGFIKAGVKKQDACVESGATAGHTGACVKVLLKDGVEGSGEVELWILEVCGGLLRKACEGFLGWELRDVCGQHWC